MSPRVVLALLVCTALVLGVAGYRIYESLERETFVDCMTPASLQMASSVSRELPHLDQLASGRVVIASRVTDTTHRFAILRLHDAAAARAVLPKALKLGYRAGNTAMIAGDAIVGNGHIPSSLIGQVAGCE